MASVGDLLIGGLESSKTTALANAFQIKANGPVSLSTLTVHNYNASARMVLLLDLVLAPSVTVPQAGAYFPVYAFPIAASTTAGPGAFTFQWAPFPLKFVSGCWVVLSTTLTSPFVLTYSGTSDGYIQGQAQTG